MKKYFGEDQHKVHNEGSYCLTDHYLAGKVQLKQLKTCIDVKWPVQTSEGQNTKEKKIDGRFINCKWECLKLIDLVDQKEKIKKVSSKKISHASMERGEGYGTILFESRIVASVHVVITSKLNILQVI